MTNHKWGSPVEPGRLVDITKYVIAGKLLNVSTFKQKLDGSTGYLYELELVDGHTVADMKAGDRVRVFGSYDLNQKMVGIDPGTFVRIRYLRTDDIEGGKTLKVFEVRKAVAAASPDDEVPF